ncbi:MAG: hypothetical protein K0R67_99 [Paenibacillus sp.]|nr:hypothetical protein [Paenibacillus sp.]
MLAYLVDEEIRRELNANGENYWDLYSGEMASMLGASAYALPLADLVREDGLSEVDVLIIGSRTSGRWTSDMKENLRRWVHDGGVAIGFAAEGLDELFGICGTAAIEQQPDDYALTAKFELWPHALTEGVHSLYHAEQKLLIFSSVRIVQTQEAEKLAHLYDEHGKDLGAPAVTWHSNGAGYAGYFCFDAAKTVWLLHEGRPIEESVKIKTEKKAANLQIIGENSRKVPYADEIAFLIRNMIARAYRPQPFIYPIPPERELVPDALFYWSGDEYFGPAEWSVGASDWMHEHGLAYHINVGVEQHAGAKDGHPMTREQFEHIKANGHEISLWYNFLHPYNEYVISEEEVRYQSELFYERYGIRAGSTLMHSTNWQGGTELARWLAKYGGLADNTFIGSPFTGNHPYVNAPFYGFGSGTSFPFHFYENYERGNERIALLEQPIVCYELGHRGSIGDRETYAPADLYEPIDTAIRYHSVMNIFYHPYYIVNFPLCRKAIEHMLQHIAEREVHIVHMGNDALADWWNARALSTVEFADNPSNDAMSFTVFCAYADGMIVTIPLRESDELVWQCDGAPVTARIKREFGLAWAQVIVPQGKHDITAARPTVA